MKELPLEIWEAILSFLSVKEILHCSRVNRYLNNLISLSDYIQYHLMLRETGLLEVPSAGKISMREKIAQVAAIKSLWVNMDWIHRAVKTITFEATSLPRVHLSLRRLVIVELALARQDGDIGARVYDLDQAHPHQITSEHPKSSGKSTLLPQSKFGLEGSVVAHSVDEDQDLVVFLVESPYHIDGMRRGTDIQLIFESISNPPDSSRTMRVLLKRVTNDQGLEVVVRTLADLAIVGRNIAMTLQYRSLVLSNIRNSTTSDVYLICVDSLTGKFLAFHETEYDAVEGISVVSPDIIMVYPKKMRVMDLLKLPSHDRTDDATWHELYNDISALPQFTKLLTLELPQRLSQHLSFQIISSPYYCTPEKPKISTVVNHPSFITDARQSLILVGFEPFYPGPELGRGNWLVIQRSSLVALVKRVVGANNLGGHATPRSGQEILEWSQWGPGITRWISLDNPLRPAVYGQRILWRDHMSRELVVWDFNEYVVKRAKQLGQMEAQESNGQDIPFRRRIVNWDSDSPGRFYFNLLPRCKQLPYLETRIKVDMRVEDMYLNEWTLVGEDHVNKHLRVFSLVPMECAPNKNADH